MDEDYVLEKIITESYIERLSRFSATPSSISVLRNCDSVFYKNAYDIIYPELEKNNKLDEYYVHHTLSKWKFVHSFQGTVYFDCQNILFPELSRKILLLEGGKEDNLENKI